MRRLFFYTILTITSILSSVRAVTLYPPLDSQPIVCSGTGSTCTIITQNFRLYAAPNHPDNGIGIVDPIVYMDLSFEN